MWKRQFKAVGKFYILLRGSLGCGMKTSQDGRSLSILSFDSFIQETCNLGKTKIVIALL